MSSEDNPNVENEPVINVPEYKKKPVPEQFNSTQETAEDVFHVDVPRFLEEFQRLLDVTDPPTDPYSSKYLACDILTVLRSKLDSLLSEATGVIKLDIEQQIAQIDYLIGVTDLDTEELANGEKHLSSAVEILRKRFVLTITYYHIPIILIDTLLMFYLFLIFTTN